MKTSANSTFITLAFFSGTFLLAFSTEDNGVAAVRIVAYLAFFCLLTVAFLYKDKIKSLFQQPAKDHMSDLLSNAESFSKEYGDIYLMADNLKRQRKNKMASALTEK